MQRSSGLRMAFGGRVVLAAVVVALVIQVATAQAQAAGASVEVTDGTLRIAHDPGLAGGTILLYYPPRPALPEGGYAVDFGEISGGARGPGFGETQVRSGTCVSTGRSSVGCPIAGVNRIVIEAGDGDDEIAVGARGFQTFSPETAPIPVPISIFLGDGNDNTYLRMNRQPVSVDGGNGNDAMRAGGPGASPSGPEDGVISSGHFVGGPGNDGLNLRAGALSTTFLGGPGRDSAGGVSTGTAVLDGGADADSFGAKHVSGTLQLLGGEGPDSYSMNDLDSSSSARTEVRAGPGDDTIAPRFDDEGRDLIDCGPGSDKISSSADTPATLLDDHTYVDCPVAAVQAKNRKLSSGSGQASKAKLSSGPGGPLATFTLSTRQSGKATVRISKLNINQERVFRSRPVKVRLIPGRPSKVKVKITKAILRLRRTRLRITIAAVSASGDRARLNIDSLFKR